MKTCPYCGKRFNLWQRATGENKEHVRFCFEAKRRFDPEGLASICRGCPAGCFDDAYGRGGKEE